MIKPSPARRAAASALALDLLDAIAGGVVEDSVSAVFEKARAGKHLEVTSNDKDLGRGVLDIDNSVPASTLGV